MRCLNCHRDNIRSENCPHCGVNIPTLVRDLLPAGKRLNGGSYEVDYALGRGGFGVTYLAHYTVLNEPVAIKEYFPSELSYRASDLTSIQTRSNDQDLFLQGLHRFVREGRLLWNLSQPHLVRVTDFFEENGTAYLVMEYLQGKTLKQLLDAAGGKLSPQLAKDIAVQMVAALATVHRQEMYHLDLKPENIVIENGIAKLIDFRSGRQEGGSTRSTLSFNQQYVPIEVMSNGQIGAFSDIFELGMMLYELLTGKLPPAVLQRMMNPTWKPEGLSFEWTGLLEQALQLQPQARPQEIVSWWESYFGSLASDLERLEHTPSDFAGIISQQGFDKSKLESQLKAAVAERSAPEAKPKQAFKDWLTEFTAAAIDAPILSELEIKDASSQAASEMAILTRNKLGMKFALIQPGSFLMGSTTHEKDRNPNEVPHRVTLTEAFYMQTTQVTQGQWEELMGNNPSHFKGFRNLPVENISWQDCQKFIQKLNAQEDGTYRLPTEAEWEYVCRAGSSGPFGIGDGQNLDSSQANFNGEVPYGEASIGVSRAKTTPVGSFQPNAWGIFDMHGNVDEWCQDWFLDFSTEAVTDPVGPAEGVFRVARGGCWRSSARGCRSARRFGGPPGSASNEIGFRLVRLVSY